MKNLKLLKLVCICILIVFSCSKDDDEQTIDPRLEFIGAYQISETETQIISGTNPTQLNIGSKVRFNINNSLNENELSVDMKDYIEDFYREIYSYVGYTVTNVDVTIDNPIIAQVSGNTFEISNAEFEVVISILGEEEVSEIDNIMDVEGAFYGNTLIFDSEIDFTHDTASGHFDVESEGEKD